METHDQYTVCGKPDCFMCNFMSEQFEAKKKECEPCEKGDHENCKGCKCHIN